MKSVEEFVDQHMPPRFISGDMASRVRAAAICAAKDYAFQETETLQRRVEILKNAGGDVVRRALLNNNPAIPEYAIEKHVLDRLEALLRETP